MVNFPRSVSELQRSAEFIWEWNVSERSNGSGTNSLPANSWCLVTHRLRLVKNLKNCVLNTADENVHAERFKGTNKSLWAVTERRKQEFHCTVTTSLTDSLLFILAFSVRLPNHERLSETFWLHVAFLHHHFSFYFTWTFLSFHFCLIIRILLSQTRDSHMQRTVYKDPYSTATNTGNVVLAAYGDGVWRRGEVALDTGWQRKTQRGTKDWEEFCNRWRRRCWSDKEPVSKDRFLYNAFLLYVSTQSFILVHSPNQCCQTNTHTLMDASESSLGFVSCQQPTTIRWVCDPLYCLSYSHPSHPLLFFFFFF